VSARGRAFFAVSLIVLGAAAVTLVVASDSSPRARSAALRLSLLRAASGDPDRQPAQQRPSGPGTRTVVRFPRGTAAAAIVAKPPNGISFGQPAIAGVAAHAPCARTAAISERSSTAEKNTTLTLGCFSRIRSRQVSPSTSGSRRSISTTSGRALETRGITCEPDVASPTISKSFSLSSALRTAAIISG
jgi:hypothetical protein